MMGMMSSILDFFTLFEMTAFLAASRFCPF
jgi:hypothetical protein